MVDVLVERVAGLDIGKASVTVCVRVPGAGGKRQGQTRTFSTMTRPLGVMADWLVEQQVTLAAMESTATYWKPVFYCLEERMECWLLNAAHMKAVPGRKSEGRGVDRAAARARAGPPEFRATTADSPATELDPLPQPAAGGSTRDATRMEKLLEDASIKLSVVASNITGVSSRAVLAALVAGERDPAVMAQLAKGRMRARIPDLTEALIGRFDDHHAALVEQMLARLRHIHDAMVVLDELIADQLKPWTHQIELLMTIHGVGPKTAQVFIAETGGDMTRFGWPARLAARVGVAPAMHESAGHRSPAGTRAGNKWLASLSVSGHLTPSSSSTLGKTTSTCAGAN